MLAYETVKSTPSEWRVEAIDYDNEGVIYVAIFTGPEAQERAEEYALWKNGQRRPISGHARELERKNAELREALIAARAWTKDQWPTELLLAVDAALHTRKAV